eukprot:TRINITY_DN16110_c1_g1_i1.p1 TRINITY_DN16110_c1_g1~~TRINITY_DN16110_c1_g1_i1.p1  ORF type:complete len:321 (+),score=61.63 TRINITY_DN16110_c1_g1_i1:59-964(+)
MNESDVLSAVKEIIELIRASKATTFQELEDEINGSVKLYEDEEGSMHSLAVVSGCEIFRQFITRLTEQQLAMEFTSLKEVLCTRAVAFYEASRSARQVIAEQLYPFLRENSCLLVHGFSRTVFTAVAHAARTRRLRVYVTEARPSCEGYKFLKALQDETDGSSACAATAQLIPDTAVASLMPQFDCVLLGAGVVTENGGIVNNVGSYQIAVLAKALSKPVYVCTETLKLAKIYPLDQSELPPAKNHHFHLVKDNNPPALSPENLSDISVDYTPPQYITQIYTDLGIMTPAAMSDELLKLYT